ncbi:hypothetical protein J7K43_00055 [Candidatus Calescamantes bacterium]|nr:hypothetical protein [Candidatus Calescamantes bacterium]
MQGKLSIFLLVTLLICIGGTMSDASEELLSRPEIVTTEHVEGNNHIPVLQADFNLVPGLKVSEILYWEMALYWVSPYSEMEVCLLDLEKKVRSGVLFKRDGGDDPGSINFYVVTDAGRKVMSTEPMQGIDSPYHRHRQFRLKRQPASITLSIHDGKSRVWQSESLPFKFQGELVTMRLNLRNDKSSAIAFYDKPWKWLYFRSVCNVENRYFMAGTIRGVGVTSIDGEEQLDKMAEKTLREGTPKRPNLALFPPIKFPYFFACYGGECPPHAATQPAVPAVKYELPLQNLEVASYDHGYTINWWLNRGVLPLVWVFGSVSPTQTRTREEWIEYYLSFARRGYPGIAIDEIQDDKVRPDNRFIFEACRIVKEKYPDFFIAIHHSGGSELAYEALRKGYVDLNILMCYTYVPTGGGLSRKIIRQNIKKARAAGVIEKTIPHLGWIDSRPPKGYEKISWGMTPEALERLIRFVRRVGPEMPGICLYTWYGFGRSPEQYELMERVNELLHKYYVQPAPKVEIRLTPKAQILTGRVKVQIKAIPSANGETIQEYKIFLDDKMVASQQEWVWDTTRTTPGRHLLTAHAVSTDWQRGATQVEVTVGKEKEQ